MILDIEKVLTGATSERAHAGQLGWFGDSIMDLIGAMSKNPVELKEIRSEFHYPFLDSAGKGYLFFYPSDEPVKYWPFNEAGINQLVGKEDKEMRSRHYYWSGREAWLEKAIYG